MDLTTTSDQDRVCIILHDGALYWPTNAELADPRMSLNFDDSTIKLRRFQWQPMPCRINGTYVEAALAAL